ncbi:hypothetical protein BpHYR1_019996, partial [Brachionus plicatilis]
CKAYFCHEDNKIKKIDQLFKKKFASTNSFSNTIERSGPYSDAISPSDRLVYITIWSKKRGYNKT